MTENETNEPIERELMDLPERAMDLGAIERIEDALAAEAVLGPVVVETKPGLIKRRVPVWGMLAASLLLACGAGMLGWMVKPDPMPEPELVNYSMEYEETEKSTAEPVIEVVRLDRPLFERHERTGIDPSRWTMGH